MNALEDWFCSTAFWQRANQRQLLPWLLDGVDAGDHLLELGSGPGAATDELRRRMPRVTSIEYSHAFAANLAARLINPRSDSTPAVAVVRGDAATLPFADGSFSSAIAVLMLHHLQSAELQRRAFSEISRVLRPGGVLLGFEIRDGWLHRAIHYRSTFVPVDAAGLSGLLAAAGFDRTAIDARFGGFRFRATRAA
jgi:SAM-dependent methyltransferase